MQRTWQLAVERWSRIPCSAEQEWSSSMLPFAVGSRKGAFSSIVITLDVGDANRSMDARKSSTSICPARHSPFARGRGRQAWKMSRHHRPGRGRCRGLRDGRTDDGQSLLPLLEPHCCCRPRCRALAVRALAHAIDDQSLTF